MSMVSLGDLMAKRVPSLNPAQFKDEEFELWSIPAFDAGSPEHLTGAEIGSSKKILQPGDILLSRIVPHIRRSWVVSPSARGARQIGSGEWIVFRSARVDPNYLRHFLISDVFHPQFMQTVAGVGGSLLRARPEGVKEISLFLPPLHEQKRIAAILDQADELRRKRQRAIDRLNQLGQAIFHEMFGDPATNPKGFEALPLGEAVDFIGGSQPAKSHFLYEDGPDRVRFVQIRDFRTDKYPTWVPKALAKRPFSEDDVMIGRYGPPVFQIFRGLSGTYNVALMKAKPRLHLTSDFVFYLLQEPKLHSFVVANSERTAGQSGVNLDLLEKYPAYAPPATLLSAFSDRIAALIKQESACSLAGRNAEALFSSLQHRAFQGEL